MLAVSCLDGGTRLVSTRVNKGQLHKCNIGFGGARPRWKKEKKQLLVPLFVFYCEAKHQADRVSVCFPNVTVPSLSPQWKPLPPPLPPVYFSLCGFLNLYVVISCSGLPPPHFLSVFIKVLRGLGTRGERTKVLLFPEPLAVTES